jgi:hypothetical protein
MKAHNAATPRVIARPRILSGAGFDRTVSLRPAQAGA